MLTGFEKEGCIAILNHLPDDEIMTLAQTVTTRQLVLRSRQDAVEAIVTFTTGALELLKRKKMKREYLFRYLAQNYISISPTAEKHQLAQTIVELWSGGNSQTIPNVRPVKIEPGYEGNPPPAQQDHRNANSAANNLYAQPIKTEPAGNVNGPFAEQNQVNAGAYTPNKQPANEQNRQPFRQNQIASSSTAGQSVAIQDQAKEHNQEMCLAFAQWFYKLLNAQNPQSGIVSTEVFGSQHFYTDCRFLLLSATPQVSKMEYTGADITAQRLCALVKEEQLLLNPNLTPEGIKGKSDPHGLMQVLVCGSVHQKQSPIGIFEQQFGLIQEPATNKWKIKFTNLKFRTQHTDRMPTLEQTRDVLPIECI